MRLEGRGLRVGGLDLSAGETRGGEVKGRRRGAWGCVGDDLG